MRMEKDIENMCKEELLQEVKEMRRELRILSLRRKVTPHFLFNSISVAVSLVMQDPKMAMRFLRYLANMYRYLLTYGNDYSVPVEQELEMMQQYYKLMSLRHVDSISLDISEEVKELKGHPLPPLALQGLLENAIKHNTHTKEQPLEVKLTVEEGSLCISNAIVPLASEVNSTKMGLAYMKEMMMLLFSREIEIRNDGVIFKVMLPLI